jgi:hypothetical protein
MPDLQLNPDHRATIDRCLDSIAQSNPGIAFTAILVGSVVRGTETERSDIDVVLLAATPLVVIGCDARMHVQAFTYESFATKLRTGDDFAAWCVRLGVPVPQYAAGWQAIVSSPDASVWPDWKHKISHAARRLILADDMRRIGDLTAASEESLYAAAHVSRAILLKSGVFPLSRPELVSQVSRDNPVLSEILRRLLLQDEDVRFLNRAVRYLKRLLMNLDKAGFGRFAQDRIREIAAKAGRSRRPARSGP